MKALVIGMGRREAKPPKSRRRHTVLALVAAVVATLSAQVTLGSVAARADTFTAPGPIVQPPADSYTADALPTVQINGVAWSQAVVGNTVYVGGSFTTARPAGSPAGSNEVTRNNLLAYDVTTGALIDSFDHDVNGQIQAVAASPDGSRVYVAGNFTEIDGFTHNRIAAFSTSTGALLSTFNASLDAGVHALAVSNTIVYAGGLFQTSRGVARANLAAFDTQGDLTAWAPTTNDTVEGMTLTPDGSRLIIAGHFTTINGVPAYGMGSVDAVTGASEPWAVNSLLRDAGSNSAMLSLTTDGTNVIGTGYSFSQGGNFEGTFAADPNTGNLVWMEDCHGDTYSAFAAHGVVWTVGHQHYCGNDNGWPVWPTWQYRHSVAFTDSVTGVLSPNSQSNYASFAGQPAPSIVNHFPDLDIGTYTGQGQAAWTVTGNNDYLVEGGEFPTVNGTAQQGLVRFAVRPIAPAQSGPRVTGAHFTPNVNSYSTGTAHISFQANWDRDSKVLSYKLVRNSDTAHPIWTGNVESEWWNRPQVSVTDTGLTPGVEYKYRLYATDPDGNQVAGDAVFFTPPGYAGLNGYDQSVIGDGATAFWPLNEASGAVAFDNANGNDADVTGVTRGTGGPVSPDTGTTFAGSSSSYMSTRTPMTSPNTFTISAWVKTTTTRGGKIIGFGSWQTGSSQNYDRQLYLNNSGLPYFGVKTSSGNVTINGATAINDGQWHNVVGQLGSAGMTLYVDGLRIARRTDVTAGQAYVGWWRIGGDALSGWSGAPSSGYLSGSIADVAIFPTALSDDKIQSEYLASGRTPQIAAAPTDSYGQAVYADDPDIFWRLDETSGAVANDTSRTHTNGAYSGNPSFNQASPVDAIGKAVAFNGSNTTIGSSKSYVNPTVYSEEAWFKTSTAAGGKIIGFGNRQSGSSNTVDRHIYMLTNGHLVFGVNAGSRVTVETTQSYNDNKWHQVVATQGPDGMTLYVDGLRVGSNAAASAQNYTGFWRVGGDTSWSGANYFNGLIDDVSIYSTELSPQRVLAHYKASPGQTNRAPTATFTSSVSYLGATFDATGSSDSDGTVASYAWDFGDGSTGNGATPSHSYATAGVYTVTLTVTDNDDGTNSVSQSVTVTDPPPNQNPLASFTSSCTGTACDFDATASSDPDGSVVSYAWDFGDGTTDSGATPSHTFPTGDTYPVTLTVTDNRGGTDTASHSVTVYRLPTAAFTTSMGKLTAAFDAGGSSAPDGSLTSYAWDFGDGATGNGATTSHTYATAGTYTATLTVTDNHGGTDRQAKSIKATAPGLVTYAADAFSRTTNSGLGTADIGGAWTVGGGSSNFSAGNGTGNIRISTAGTGPFAVLNGVSAGELQGVIDFSADSTPTGGGTLVSLEARRVGTTYYMLKAKLLAGSVTLSLSKVVGGTETVLLSKVISGVTYTGGDQMRMRFELTGASPTSLFGRVWKIGTPEPSSWQVSTTDATADLQGSGGIGIQAYLASTATTAPVTVSFDNLSVTSIAAAAFSSSAHKLDTSFDASGSSMQNGTITSYAWDFGDGTTGNGVAPNHTYAATGTYPVTLTITGSDGATDTISHELTVSSVDRPPVAAFTSSTTSLSASFDASGSSDPDGTIVSYAWDFGDSSTGDGVTPNHTFPASGSYTVTLTVTDNDGSTDSISQVVSVLGPNQLPTAAFTDTANELSVQFDGTGSSDPDGTIASYAWDFGDGTTGTGATPTHTFGSPATYPVKLTVTDDRGGSTSITNNVTINIANAIAADTFGRTVTNGWGSADVGGAYTLNGSGGLFSVSSGAGRIKLNATGAGPSVRLDSVSARDVNITVDASFDSVPTGGGTFAYAIARHSGNNEYRFKVKVQPTSSTLYLTKLVAGTETTIATRTINMTYALGDVLRLRFTAIGSAPTALTGRVWKVGTAEPASPQVTASDADASLQTAGSVGLQSYLSGSSTLIPVVTSFANYTVAAAG
ncbi:MAG: PKD domain-containing protein [Mycobacterium sp.]|nr:PKD domain-containing protein [Mycobacterium sp.]